MKLIIEISDSLLHEVRKVAARAGVTLRTFVERGLRRVITDARPKARFKLRRASFGGRGLQPDLRDASWNGLRDPSYEGRGG